MQGIEIQVLEFYFFYCLSSSLMATMAIQFLSLSPGAEKGPTLLPSEGLPEHLIVKPFTLNLLLGFFRRFFTKVDLSFIENMQSCILRCSVLSAFDLVMNDNYRIRKL